MNSQSLSDLLEKRGLNKAALAKLMGVNKATVTRWAQGRIPADRLIDIERATGIVRHELRPDLYEPADAAE